MALHEKGYYYGAYKLPQNEREHNVGIITAYLREKGWTDNAIAGVLGNMEGESSFNPGAYFGYKEFSSTSFGLTQWDPTKKYQEWHDIHYPDLPYHDIWAQLDRLDIEMQGPLDETTGVGVQYIVKPDYPISRKEFVKSTESPYYLAGAFAWNYERSYDVLYGTDADKAAVKKSRGTNAEKWFEFITGNSFPPANPDPEPSTGSGNKMDLMILILASKRRRSRVV